MKKIAFKSGFDKTEHEYERQGVKYTLSPIQFLCKALYQDEYNKGVKAYLDMMLCY